MRRAAVVLLCVGAVLACKTDEDCHLNGVCDTSSNTCACDKPWTGSDDCGLLEFLPSPISSCGPACAFHGPEADYSTWTTWGGSVLEVNSTKGRYRMLAAEMANHCGLNDWGSNSRVTQAYADTVAGPYKWDSVAVPPWAHNPEAIIAPDGTHVLFILGTGRPHEHEKNCSAGEPIVSKHAEPPLSLKDYNITVFHSKGPDGPWEPHPTWIYDLPEDSNMRNYNPAPYVYTNGRVRLMVHTDVNGKAWTGEVITEAPTWEGPYKSLTGDVTHCVSCQEDPYVWIDKRGYSHALYHVVDDGHWTGGHMFSRDGLTWGALSRAYNTTFLLPDNKSVVAHRRERPKLFIGPDRVPTHLFNGIEIEGHGTFTGVAPLNV